MAVTMADIARACEVSTGAVSQVLRNPSHPRFTPKTRRKIIDTAQAMNYVPNGVAQQLREGQTMLVHLITPYNIPELLDEVGRQCSANGYSVVVQSVPWPEEDIEFKAVKRAVAQRVDGIVWLPAYPVSYYRRTMAMLNESGIPVVMLETSFDEIKNGDFVGFDYEQACVNAVDHLIEQGYRRLVHLTYDEEMATRRRIAGLFRKAAAHRSVEAIVLTSGNPHGNTGYSVEKCLDDVSGPLGVLTEADTLAIDLLAAISQRNLRTPQDVGIVNIGDLRVAGKFRLCELLTPSLTSVFKPFHVMSAEAIRLLMLRMKHSRDNIVPPPQTAKINLPLTLRESSALSAGTGARRST